MTTSHLTKLLHMQGLAPHEFDTLRAEARSSGRDVTEIMQQRLGLPPEEVTRLLGEAFHYPIIALPAMRTCDPAFELLAFSEALQRQCVPLRRDDQLLLVFADPFDLDLLAWGEARLPFAFDWVLASKADVLAYLSQHEENIQALHSAMPTPNRAQSDDPTLEELSLLRINEDASPVVKVVNSTLYDALKLGASDVHFETDAEGLVLKYRIDGVLSRAGARLDRSYAEQVISRIKVVAGLDIAERRIPQDGRFKVSVRGREVDFRVSIMPSLFGEDAVLRILDKNSLSGQLSSLRLTTLGFDSGTLERMARLIREPYGMVLVTGPTGSGKTTTLYAAVSEINNGEDKIITIEDPVEYQLPGILQIPVNEKKGLTFARGLRSVLRHDPDTIMVGEIRDNETAQIAIQAGLTGHLVFTTVHANNIFDVLYRFTHMGIDVTSFYSALNGILAQRLVRLVCQSCVKPVTPATLLLRDSGLEHVDTRHYDFVAGHGCAQCRGTGYRGRRAIGELLTLSDELREAFLTHQPIGQLKRLATQSGTVFLRAAALSLVAQGQTTLQEVNRVTFVH